MALTKENVYLDIGSERVKFICHASGQVRNDSSLVKMAKEAGKSVSIVFNTSFYPLVKPILVSKC